MRIMPLLVAGLIASQAAAWADSATVREAPPAQASVVHPVRLKRGNKIVPDGNGGYVVVKSKFREIHPKVYGAYRKTRTVCVRISPIVSVASSVGSFIILVFK